MDITREIDRSLIHKMCLSAGLCEIDTWKSLPKPVGGFLEVLGEKIPIKICNGEGLCVFVNGECSDKGWGLSELDRWTG